MTNAGIDHLGSGMLFVLRVLGVLANPVEDHNGIVDRITQNGQNCGDEGTIQLNLEQGENAKGYQNIMGQCQNGGQCIFELKANGDVDQHQYHGN